MKFVFVLVLCISIVYANRHPHVGSSITPTVSCQINTATTCITYFGYISTYNQDKHIPVGILNWLNQLPMNRGQPTHFKANTHADRVFNITRPCHRGPLIWTLVDPRHFAVKFAIADTRVKNTCGSLPPVHVPIAAPAHTPISAPIATPVHEPVSTPIDVPIAIPVAEPVSVPISPPIDVPIASPVAVPVSPPIDVPIAIPVAEPIAAPISVPVAEPVSVPISPPIDVPIASPVAVPVSTPIDVPVSVPIAAPISPPLCSQVVRQACTSSSNCPLSAPICNTTIGRCQTLAGGACNVTSDCLEGQGITCDVNTCTCVGGKADTCTTKNYIDVSSRVDGCVPNPGSCNILLNSPCRDLYVGTATQSGYSNLANFQSAIECSAGELYDGSSGCNTLACITNNCNQPTCPAVTLTRCRNDSDCNMLYPFCDTNRGVCMGAGGSPCGSQNDCGTRLCQAATCTCETTQTACSSPAQVMALRLKLIACFNNQTGTCAQKINNCQLPYSYLAYTAITNITVISAINTCLSSSSASDCSVDSCISSGCQTTIPKQCASDLHCPCGYCCAGGGVCQLCTDTCVTSSDCTTGRSICANINKRCTSNPQCGSSSTPVNTPVDSPKAVTPLPGFTARVRTSLIDIVGWLWN